MINGMRMDQIKVEVFKEGRGKVVRLESLQLVKDLIHKGRKATLVKPFVSIMEMRDTGTREIE